MKLARWALSISAVVAMGCSPPSHPPYGASSITPDATPASDAAATPDAAAPPDAATPDPDGPPGELIVDCAALPSGPLSVTMLSGARGYHGLAIADDGTIIGSNGSNLIKATYDGVAGVFVPGIGSGQQMDWLADGDLVFATSNGALTRVMSTGAYLPITTDVHAYGVVRGPDDMIYAVSNLERAVMRVDPATGIKETLIPEIGVTMHSIGFSPDGRRLYIGTIGNGTVYYADLDQDMNVTGPVQVLASGMGGWHDAVGVDACGNLYVPDYTTRSLYRVTPSGDVALFWQPAGLQLYPHGLVWGTGEHGWRDDALYVPQPYNGNTVTEVVIGVPSRDFTGTVLNMPPMKP